jgi:lipopolysaccharide/colanic/teichoic acid biosynthesis glycosyltransferase
MELGEGRPGGHAPASAFHFDQGVFMAIEIESIPVTIDLEGLHSSKRSLALSLKVAVEFIIALGLLVVTLPIMALAVLLVKLTSAGPGIYSQARLGRHGRPYRIYKIRTMIHNCEHLTGPQWSTPGDWRITKVGRFLRRTHLDELPQLWNVLRGDMSLVGPRPERPEFAIHLEEVIPLYRSRLVVRPGVTGLAQVQLPADTDLESVRTKLAYDLYYVQNLNPWLDFKIIVSTAFKVLGVSFATMRRRFRLPRPEKVLGNFERLTRKNGSSLPTLSVPLVQFWDSVRVASTNGNGTGTGHNRPHADTFSSVVRA